MGGRRGSRQHCLQSPQVARGAVRLLDPVSCGPRTAGSHLGVRPDYLQTLGQTEITNYSEWTIPLGRRFRALKLWFLLRAHGLEDLRQRIRNHIAWAEEAAAAIALLDGFG